MNNKRGLSAIVITLMLILLAFVAVGIIWAVVNNIVTRGAEEIDATSKCLEIDFEQGVLDCSAGTSGDDCDVTVERKAGGDDVAGIKIVLTNSSAQTNYIHDEPGNINPLEVKTVIVTETGILNINEVNIVPYLEDSAGNAVDCTI